MMKAWNENNSASSLPPVDQSVGLLVLPEISNSQTFSLSSVKKKKKSCRDRSGSAPCSLRIKVKKKNGRRNVLGLPATPNQVRFLRTTTRFLLCPLPFRSPSRLHCRRSGLSLSLQCFVFFDNNLDLFWFRCFVADV